jgi:type IV fimbrial biogenesis protein FimT
MNAKRARGFTIIELMTVMVVIGVLATIAAPSLRDVVIRTRLKTAASDLHSSLMLARSEAIKRNCEMNVVPVNAADWSQGWSVKITTKTTPTAGFCPFPLNPAAGTVLTRQDPYQNITIATAAASVTFAGTGREPPGSAAAAFVFTSANYPGIPARCVTVDPSGRAAIRTAGCN